MKITKQRLREIIKEEYSAVQEKIQTGPFSPELISKLDAVQKELFAHTASLKKGEKVDPKKLDKLAATHATILRLMFQHTAEYHDSSNVASAAPGQKGKSPLAGI